MTAVSRNGRSGRPAPPVYRLRLYVAGQSPRSLAALENLRRLVDDALPGRCRVEVVDLVQHPERAKRDQILAIPTLIRRTPLPLRRIAGDLSDAALVLAELELRAVRGN